MVKFGERLPTLMVAAWKDKYIDYERLKAMLEDGALDAAASSAFYKELAAEIGKVEVTGIKVKGKVTRVSYTMAQPLCAYGEAE